MLFTKKKKFNFQYRVTMPLAGGPTRSTGVINVMVPARNERHAKKLLSRHVKKSIQVDVISVKSEFDVNEFFRMAAWTSFVVLLICKIELWLRSPSGKFVTVIAEIIASLIYYPLFVVAILLYFYLWLIWAVPLQALIYCLYNVYKPKKSCR